MSRLITFHYMYNQNEKGKDDWYQILSYFQLPNIRGIYSFIAMIDEIPSKLNQLKTNEYTRRNK